MAMGPTGASSPTENRNPKFSDDKLGKGFKTMSSTNPVDCLVVSEADAAPTSTEKSSNAMKEDKGA